VTASAPVIPAANAGSRGEATGVVVELAQLRFAWSGAGPPVLDIDSLRITPGERVFLRGPSGSGKSSLLSPCSSIIQPRSAPCPDENHIAIR